MSMRYSDTDRIYDELLLTRIQAGDRRAGERLAARWHPRLMRTAYRLLRDEEQARVAVQEAWSGICRGWIGLRDPSRFPAWAYKILHRKCADRIRKVQKYRGTYDSDVTDAEISLPPSAENRVSIDQAFGRLSDDHRFVATLYFSEGLTLAEIATATGTALGTAKSRLFHARRHLKMALSEDSDE
ncbi:sigma-70 family RNA polymerase sigma factor [Sphingorhabdus sp. Alg231-15]|uniref:sigma-70 family RNA polymerase sigma factor n=1 Tax=Sphingorhabdus sp. Alg231-15 TaxID=1922222 RepID=UPI000D5609BD